ncbi:hypothetical protein BRADI_2g30485v3 [Brachypodium distachyon]|uniref:Uncharacterized protein n=1 Tax=Brachypodium distachyon TaxID=15368 RepID=A0A0Q3G638_BRADI|nr:hypothetical protein BRADI_2g30485v3 [Brachypodium distachyon]
MSPLCVKSDTKPRSAPRRELYARGWRPSSSRDGRGHPPRGSDSGVSPPNGIRSPAALLTTGHTSRGRGHPPRRSRRRSSGGGTGAREEEGLSSADEELLPPCPVLLPDVFFFIFVSIK